MSELEKVRFHLENKNYIEEYHEKIRRKWMQIEIDTPLEARLKNFSKNSLYWNHHVALECLSTLYPIQRYLEVGCRIGASTVIVLGNRIAHLTAVDKFIPYAKAGVEESEENFRRQIEPFIETTSPAFRIMKEDSHSAMKDLIGIDERYDLILIDGDHSPEGAEEDLEDAIQLLNKDEPSFIVFDDINNKGCPWLREVALDFEERHVLNSIWNDKDDNGTVIFSRH